MEKLFKNQTRVNIIFAFKALFCILFSVCLFRISFSNGFIDDPLTAVNIAKIFLKLFYLLILTGLVFVAVYKFEDAFAVAKEVHSKSMWIYAAVLSMNYLLLYNPMDSSNTKIRSFKRVIGQGVMSGYDISSVIGNFSKWFICFFVIFFLMLLLIGYVQSLECNDEQKKAWEFLDDFIVLAGLNTVLKCVSWFYEKANGDMFCCSSAMAMFILFSVFYYILGNMNKKITFDTFQSVIIVTFSLSFPILAILSKHNLIGLQVVLLVFSMFLIKQVKCIEGFLKERQIFLFFSTVAVSALPFFLSLYVESVNVLTGRGISFNHVRIWCVIIIVFLDVMWIFFVKMFFVDKRKIINEKKIAYPMLVLGITALANQVPLVQTYGIHSFESANAGVLISDFLNFGRIPIVEHYGGHMMTGVWEGILYGIVNQDTLGAVASPYSNMLVPVVAVAFFYLVENIWNEDIAFWTALLFPYYGAVSYFGQGLFVILAVIAFIKKNSYFRAVAIWLSCVWCVLYRLDLGFAFTVSCVVALICYILSKRKWEAIKPLFVTLFVNVILFGGLWFFICAIKRLNPITRLVEFLQLSASNSNWAYNNIGNPENIAYACCYLLVPFLVLSSLVCVLFSDRFQKKIGIARWTILIILGSAYLVNFSRGLVRHSLVEVENSIIIRDIILFTACLYIAVFLSCYLKKQYFLPVFFIMIMTYTLLAKNVNFFDKSFFNQANGTLISMHDTWKAVRRNGSGNDAGRVQRVVFNEEIKEELSSLQQLTEVLLENNETYIDFINASSFYFMLGKEDPVYVSQSPLQLSGEYTQECFIEEINRKKENLPIVVMPHYSLGSLDGIVNNYRYYKVSEFLYQNYVPLCHNGNFAVWCANERYMDLNAKIEKEINNSKNQIEYIQENRKSFECHNLAINHEETNISLASLGDDSQWLNYHEFIELDDYIGKNVKMSIQYKANMEGEMQLFYTQDKGEKFSEEKSVINQISFEGVTTFTIPVTEYTKIRLDIPESSQIVLTSIILQPTIEKINYENAVMDEMSGEYNNNISTLHHYKIQRLPEIWGDLDEKKASENLKAASVAPEGDIYKINGIGNIDKKVGNYLLLNASYSGKKDSVDASITMGSTQDDNFVEKYGYSFTIERGRHKYLIRISSDYFWYSDTIDTIRLNIDDKVEDVSMSILQGD